MIKVETTFLLRIRFGLSRRGHPNILLRSAQTCKLAVRIAQHQMLPWKKDYLQPVNNIRAEERDLLQVQFDSAERKRKGRINDAGKEEIHAKVCEALDWETI
jgi:hypothetical protein